MSLYFISEEDTMKNEIPATIFLRLLLNILDGVLVFKLSAVHCCTLATILIQGQAVSILVSSNLCDDTSEVGSPGAKE